MHETLEKAYLIKARILLKKNMLEEEIAKRKISQNS
jgi:hypothetical protein